MGLPCPEELNSLKAASIGASKVQFVWNVSDRTLGFAKQIAESVHVGVTSRELD